MPISNPIGAVVIIGENQVFTGASPGSWTDLDLSPTIGSQETIVLLKITKGISAQVGFRRNGDTDNLNVGQNMGSGCSYIYHQFADKFSTVLVVTDATGKIEWIADDTDVATIDVIAYMY